MKTNRNNLINKLKEIPKDSKDLSFSISNIELIQSSDIENEKKKRAKIVAMCSGWNENDVYFSKEILTPLPSMIMKKPKLYLNHDMFAFMGRDVNEWMATFESCDYKEDKDGKGKVEGIIEFTNNPKTVWIYDEIEKDPTNVHFSTHLRGIASEDEEIEGKKGQVVKMLVDYKSTDCVSYGAAGGVAVEALSSLLNNPEFTQFLNTSGYVIKKLDANEMNSTNINNNTKNNKTGDDMEIKTLADLKANVPIEVLNTFLNEGIQSALASKENAVKLELLSSTQTELTNIKVILSAKDSEIVKLQSDVTTLTNEKVTLSTELDQRKAGETLANWKVDVDKVIKDSEIDERLITEVFKNNLYLETKIEKVKELIEDRKGLQTANLINSGIPPKKEVGEIKILTDAELVNAIQSN